MIGRKYGFIVVVTITLMLCAPLIRAEETCQATVTSVYPRYYDYCYNWYIWYSNTWRWHNMTFWGGHKQIPRKDQMDVRCTSTSGSAVVLTEKHPDIATIGEDIVTVQACSLNQNGDCESDMEVQMRKCYGDLLYSFPWINITDVQTLNYYICYDIIYAESCDGTEMVYSAGSESGKLLQFSHGDIQDGWYNAFNNGKQYVFPSVEDLNDMPDECFPHNWGFVLKEPLPQVIEETPLRLSLCYIESYDSINNNEYVFSEYGDYIFVRACSGKLQFDLSHFQNWHGEFCMIHHNNVIVKPEIYHDIQSTNVNGKAIRTYSPFLQYRCTFDMVDETLYKTNWYINGTFQVQTGPSPRSDDLVFKEEYLTHLRPGYEVQCGMITASGNESIEFLSDVFYAGWKTLKNGGEWASKKHRAKFSTIDSDYDDSNSFDLQMSVTHRNGDANRISISTEVLYLVVGAIHVDITETNRHWNKRCYSHVDPHMKTTDGIYYEAQREGDYMMALNEEFQTEIQTSARYCSDGYTDGPVCACGIAIAVGADAFIINKCPKSTFQFDFVQCGDGGIIDVEEIHAYRYRVRTPIGTIIDIFLHTWSDTMNIDIYMSAKDFGNIVGLCGYFDGDRSNDLLHRDNVTISSDNNWSYKFADSWRLTDEENLFKNNRRYLKPWDVSNGGTDQPCSRSNSITRKKCNFNRRTRRSTSDRQRRGVKTQNQITLSRKKRSTVTFTEDEAFRFCNHSIYTTPAVQEFPDKLAEEDPDQVVEQCVYDLTQGNDTAWVEAHTTVLNNAADTILGLNPVYVANNTDIVNSFRLKTCLNNCSGNGACTETGLCDCSGIFRGPDCSIDIRIPPVVYYIEGDGICEITADDDCTCFQIRTNNIFDGFMCDISKSKVYFNGTRIKEVDSRHVGIYEDIFTGECCNPAEREKRSAADEDDVDELFVVMYEFAVSNDGVNYGETNTAFVYDTTCLQQVEVAGNVTFELKTGYCYIDATCVVHNSKVLNTDECLLCDPARNPYKWTKGNCEESSTGLKTGALIGIICGSLLFAMVTGVLVYVLCFKGSKKHRTVQDAQPYFQSTLAGRQLPVTSKHDDKCSDMCMKNKEEESNNAPDTVTVLPYITAFNTAKPVSRRNVWTDSLATHHADKDTGIHTVEKSFTTTESEVLQYKGTDEVKEPNQAVAEAGIEQPEREVSAFSLQLIE
ncbi:uncharacterized protein LOC123541916 isoform X2 [Mercenaria mercenaria]|uniref:uncharacterized protein LOC123541916 isoform X2 n=1 Tax=Mercenaria mercenaria TaxID=6596 RepID=UPI00234F4E80|nr:uncharacterized protein LOC123541916 isoform X2 [Mercenaria mercenaria]